MKHLLIAALAFLAVLATTQAQAMSVWNWSIDLEGGPISGTLITDEVGYSTGTYTLDQFNVLEGPPGFLLEPYSPAISEPFTFFWDGDQAINISTSEMFLGDVWIFFNPISELFIDINDGGTALVTDNDIVNLIGPWEITPVPVPAAAWLFGSALLGLVGYSRRKSKA